LTDACSGGRDWIRGGVSYLGYDDGYNDGKETCLVSALWFGTVRGGFGRGLEPY
jgi:hypothetical protein